MDVITVLSKARDSYHQVVPFNAAVDKLYPFSFTAANTALTEELLADTAAFSNYISNQLHEAGCRYGIGGYNEHRTIYSRSSHFDAGEEPRRLHLGVDIWGEAGTGIYSPLDGTVHSFQFNNRFGDYGATLILRHELEGCIFHTLYGHLSLTSIEDIEKNTFIATGQQIGHFGIAAENGGWPPHLHFQIVVDMEGLQGDYPGVCKYSERERYLSNCPDGDLMLQLNRYI